MNSFNHFAEAEELACLLRQEGLDGYATALEAAIEGGATGTEIFMALRWNVKNILNGRNCSTLIEDKANRLYIELEKALQ